MEGKNKKSVVDNEKERVAAIEETAKELKQCAERWICLITQQPKEEYEIPEIQIMTREKVTQKVRFLKMVIETVKSPATKEPWSLKDLKQMNKEDVLKALSRGTQE